MKDSKKELENKYRWRGVGLKIAILSICLCLLPLGHFAFTFPFAGLVGYYQVPYWAEGIVGIGLFVFIGAYIGLRKALGPPKRYRKLEGGEGDPIELSVLDRFTYIKYLPGEENTTECRFFVKTTNGTWQLAADKQPMFSKLVPGTLIRAAVIVQKNSRDIMDLQILSGAKADAAPGLLNQVVDKVASEVKINTYRDGQFFVSKHHGLKELTYYLVVNNRLLPVTGGTFTKNKLNQKYQKELEQATTFK